MRLSQTICMCVCICVMFSAATGVCAGGKPADEAAKIEALIRAVENLKDAVFIRNGRGYDCGKAGEHLRAKWRWKRNEIKTARNFIRIAATGSSVSGKPYLIRFKDGREIRSADFLLAELAKLEKAGGKGGG